MEKGESANKLPVYLLRMDGTTGTRMYAKFSEFP